MEWDGTHIDGAPSDLDNIVFELDGDTSWNSVRDRSAEIPASPEIGVSGNIDGFPDFEDGFSNFEISDPDRDFQFVSPEIASKFKSTDFIVDGNEDRDDASERSSLSGELGSGPRSPEAEAPPNGAARRLFLYSDESSRLSESSRFSEHSALSVSPEIGEYYGPVTEEFAREEAEAVAEEVQALSDLAAASAAEETDDMIDLTCLAIKPIQQKQLGMKTGRATRVAPQSRSILTRNWFLQPHSKNYQSFVSRKRKVSEAGLSSDSEPGADVTDIIDRSKPENVSRAKIRRRLLFGESHPTRKFFDRRTKTGLPVEDAGMSTGTVKWNATLPRHMYNRVAKVMWDSPPPDQDGPYISDPDIDDWV